LPAGPSAALKVTEYEVEVVPLGSGEEFVMYIIPTVYIFEAVCWVCVSSTMTVNG